MKANKFMMAALFVGATAMSFNSCKPNPTPDPDGPDGPDGPNPPVVITPTEENEPEGADLTMKDGFYTIAFHPAKGTVCNDIYFVGSYAASNWTLDAENIKMEALEGFEGWYVAYIPALEDGTALQGKPIQASDTEGTLEWDYQTGDAESWEILEGDVTIEAGYSGEANLTYNDITKPVIFKSSSWKNGNSPCVEKAEHDYVIVAKLPATADETIVPAVIGDFNSWSVGVAMELQEDGTYKAAFHDAEGKSFKIKSGANDNWDIQIQGIQEDGTWKDLDNCALGEEANIVLDYSDAEKYRWTTSDEPVE